MKPQFGIWHTQYQLWAGRKVDWAPLDEHTDLFATRAGAELFLKTYNECFDEHCRVKHISE